FENYMCIYPLWSGVLLGDLARYGSDQTGSNSKQETEHRDTNCHVEKWFDIVKNDILLKQKSLRPAEFVRKMYTSMQGRYREHILQLNFPEKLLVKPLKGLREKLEQSQEEWAKKQEKDPKVDKSKYFSAPKEIPEPKAIKKQRQKDRKHGIAKVELQKKETEDTAQVILWNMQARELVLAVIHSSDGKTQYTLRHSEFLSLKPHTWLVGEVCYDILYCHLFVMISSTLNQDNM
ncbi:hypothetical protein AMEX_G27815, partial [Astyanax mexicanus]